MGIASFRRGMCVLLAALPLQAYPADVVSVRQVQPDKACGPRCLDALMRITGQGPSDCGIKCIYGLIGKEPFAATSLKDIKDTARKLGFSAKGSMLTVDELAKTNGYAILPIRISPGTPERPLHFILVKRIAGNHVIFVDTNTLRSRAFPVSELQGHWGGYSLMIEAGEGMKPLAKPPDDLAELPGIVEHTDPERPDMEQVKDFGIVDSGSSVQHTFVIPNGPDRQYTVKIVKKSCSCVTVDLGKDTEGRNTLTMKMHVSQAGWQESDVVALLEPGGLIRRYRLRAYGKDSFRIYPPIAHIEAPQGGLVEYPVRIEYLTGCSDAIVKFDRMATTVPGLECGPVRSRSSTKEGVTTITFETQLRFNANTPSGQQKSGGKVDFIFDTNEGPRHIPLELLAITGVAKFRLTPHRVFLMISRSSPSVMQTKAKLEFLTPLVPPCLVVKTDTSLPLDVKVTAISNDSNSYMIEIGVVPEKLCDLSLGLSKANLIITGEGMADPTTIALPVNLFVHP